MIIGLSGKSNSGKDTVGNIIQYLTSKSVHIMSYDQYQSRQSTARFASPFEIKRFAGKLKECISIITGISVTNLEKEEVKSQELGEEWIRYGYSDSFYRDMNGTPIMNNMQCSKEKYLTEHSINWQTAYKHRYTVRELLQLLGTEVGRNIHNDFWVNALFTDYVGKDYSTCTCGHIDENCIHEDKVIYPNWLITDTRFPNEVATIKSKGGIIIRVNRINTQIDIHPSETALDDYNFDYIIENNGTIEELIAKVKEILLKESII